jgi:hypothetical protein
MPHRPIMLAASGSIRATLLMLGRSDTWALFATAPAIPEMAFQPGVVRDGGEGMSLPRTTG